MWGSGELIESKFEAIKEDCIPEFFQFVLDNINRATTRENISKYNSLEYNDASENVKAVAANVILQNLSLEQFSVGCKWLSRSAASITHDSIIARSNNVMKYALRKALTDEKLLASFTYDVKVSVCSSKSQVLNEPLLCFHINTVSEDEEARRYYVEMNLFELREFKKILGHVVNDVNS